MSVSLRFLPRVPLATSVLCLALAGCSGGGGNSASNTPTTSTPPAVTSSTLAISAVSPASVPVGSGDLSLTVTGTGFVSGNTVQVNGVAEQTTFVSATQLTAVVPTAQLQSGSVLPVAVSNGTTTVKADPAAVSLSVNNPAPVATGLVPAVVYPGAGDTTFTLTGSGLLSSTVLQVNGAAHAATISSSQVTFTLTAAELAAASSFAVTLSNPTPGGGSVQVGSIAVQNPTPAISAIAPSTLLAGGGATTVALTGSGFLSASVVQVNGSVHASTYMSPTKISVPFTAADLASSGTFAITVINGQPGGGASAGASIPVNNPVPAITALSQTNIAAGSTDTVVTINGSGFLPLTTLQVNGTMHAVSYVSGTQLSVKFVASDLAQVATDNLTLTNAAPGGGTSAATPLYIGAPAPVITSISPSSVPVGSPATTITVNGTGFLVSSNIRYLGSLLPTIYVSSTKLTAVVPTSNLANDGVVPVSVSNPTASGGSSNVVSFVVQGNTPVAAAVSPSSLVVNNGPYTINVTGTNLTFGTQILWNGTPIPTTTIPVSTYTPTGYVYSYSLNGTVSNSLLSNIGTANITVSSSTASPAVSNTLTISITNPPVPAVTALSPNYAPVNADVKLTITGTNFTKNSVASYNGTALTTTFNSNTSLSATVPASLLPFPGNNPITVNTPAPGGGTSAGAPLTIYLPVVSNNMVFNKVNGLAYLSIPSTGSTVAGNSIVSLDPATGALGTPIFVGSEPGVMAVTDDGKSLWVALNGTVAIRKVDLTTNTAGAQYSVSAFGTATPTAMLVLPGTTDAVAVTNSSLLAVYDAGVLRGSTVSVNSVYALQADSSRSELYAGGNAAVQTYTYGTSGLTLKASNSTNSSNSVTSTNSDEMQLASGKVFTDFGKVYDAESSGLLGSFTQQTPNGTTTSTTTLVGPTLYDAALSQVYLLNNGSSYNYSNYTQVSLFSPTDYSNLNKSFAWNIPYYIYTNNNSLYLSPHRLTRWGSNGLLLHTKYAIFTAQSNVVKDQSSVSADLSVAVQSTGGLTTGGTATYTVTVKNAGPQAATDVALSLVTPSTGVITSTTSSAGTCSSFTGCTFGTLNSGGSVTATVTVLQTTAGTGALGAYVQASSTDPDMTNNSASSSVTVTGAQYNLQPTLSTISPNAIRAGSSDTTLTVTGSNFASGSQVMLGSTALTTTYVSSTQLTATVPTASVTGMTWAYVSVSSPTPGGGTSGSLPLTVFNVVTVGLNHIVYEPYSRKLYASVSSGSSSVTGSSVVSIDPATATFATPVTFSTVPTLLALSSSGNTLYTALTQPSTSTSTNTVPFGRLDLTNGSSTSPSATLSNSYYYSGYAVQALAVQPGSETTLAATLPYSVTALFDYDAAGKALKQRGSTSTSYSGNCLAFLDPNNLLASISYSYDSILPVTSSGLGTGKTLSNLTECFQLSAATLATPTGKVFNITSSAATQLGSFVLPSTSNNGSNPVGFFTLDANLGSAYFAANTQNTNYYSSADGLVSYDLQSFLRTGSLGLNIATIEGTSSYNTAINDVVRWGQDGLALVTSTGHLYLLRGPFVVPQELTANTAATLSSSSSTTLSVGSANTPLTLTGTNFVPGVAVTWNGSYRTTTRISATQVVVSIPASDLAGSTSGKLVATNPNATASNTLTIAVQ